jgi:hypothetical protein
MEEISAGLTAIGLGGTDIDTEPFRARTRPDSRHRSNADRSMPRTRPLVVAHRRCHDCETTVIAGTLDYKPDPVEPPADGSALICCSQPHEDVVLDCDRQPPGQGP